MKVNQCRNLSFDKVTGEPFCRSTHVCYKPFCKSCSTDSLGIKCVHGELVYFGNVSQMFFNFDI